MDVVFTLMFALIVLLSAALFVVTHDKKVLRKTISDMQIEQRFDMEARATCDRFDDVYQRLDAIETRCQRLNPSKD